MSVLGAVLIAETALDQLQVDVRLRPEDFYLPKHGVIWRAMLTLADRSEPVDALTVSSELDRQAELEQVGGTAYIHSLPSSVPAAAHVVRYAQIVRDRAQLRRLLAALRDAQEQVFTFPGSARELFDKTEADIYKVAHEESSGDLTRLDEILHDEVDKLEVLSREGVSLTGTPSGFKDLDNLTGGFQPGNLIILAARPAMGKSALALNIAQNATMGKYTEGRGSVPVAVFSLEMSRVEIAHRMLGAEAKISGDALRKGQVKSDWRRVLLASEKLSKAPLWIDDSSDLGIHELRAKVRRLKARQPDLGLVIVDYLQLMRPDDAGDNRVQQIGNISRGLKLLAMELKIPVIALSQLSRKLEDRTDKRPVLSDLRECVTGDTLVVLSDGRRVPIADLVGTTPEVLAVDENDHIVEAKADLVWSVGTKSVFRLQLASGRTLHATGKHLVRTGKGWQRLDEIEPGDRVALSRWLPEPAEPDRWPDARVALLGHLIGDGSYQRTMAAMRGTAYGGTSHLKFAPSRRTAASYAVALEDAHLAAAADSDLFWDRVVSIEPAGEQEVFDLTVPGPACWLADGIISHNSGAIEQDADVVMFIYRDEVYNKDGDGDDEFESNAGRAELLIRKHRNGPIDDINLVWQGQFARFMNYSPDLAYYGGDRGDER
jgi:replicative DNA helicase